MFSCCDRQFGLKKSTGHYTFAVRKAIDYDLNNGSPVYACALDVQKAFYHLNLIKLFAKLM